MAGLIPQSFIDDLINRLDIVDVVSSRVQLKKTGKNYSACCPFHRPRQPGVIRASGETQVISPKTRPAPPMARAPR